MDNTENKELFITKKQAKNLNRRVRALIVKAGIKTRGLWIASEIIQEKIEPNKTVEQVYEMLKLMGKNKLKQDKPELEKFIK